MAKAQRQYVCQECGAAYSKWQGRCDACNGWNSLVEEQMAAPIPKGLGSGRGRILSLTDLKQETLPRPRYHSGMAELDRPLGGGLVPGSAILVGGDPGIGKSTLMLQLVAHAARQGDKPVIYVSGEESVDQTRLRARRLGLGDAPVALMAETDLRDILATLETARPGLVIIDSIQTMFVSALESAPGTVSQVRAAAQELIRFAKRTDAVMVIIGHVTKEGQIAGPRVMEHMVDTVLYFEGERGVPFRILRAVKNRFGATDEIGVFEMSDGGLAEVSNPSRLFLSEREEPISGAAVFAGMEGSRPVLVEIQALVTPSPLGTPRRTVVGWDSGRLAMIMAVLEARCGVALAGNDVYLNVAGGLKIGEPAADLAVAAALISSFRNLPTPRGSVFFGEVSLAGEVRPVAGAEQRLKEAAKLGFLQAVTAKARTKGKPPLETTHIGHLDGLIAFLQETG
jgi:DNA repair protein RadA/Sms